MNKWLRLLKVLPYFGAHWRSFHSARRRILDPEVAFKFSARALDANTWKRAGRSRTAITCTATSSSSRWSAARWAR